MHRMKLSTIGCLVVFISLLMDWKNTCFEKQANSWLCECEYTLHEI